MYRIECLTISTGNFSTIPYGMDNMTIPLIQRTVLFEHDDIQAVRRYWDAYCHTDDYFVNDIWQRWYRVYEV